MSRNEFNVVSQLRADRESDVEARNGHTASLKWGTHSDSREHVLSYMDIAMFHQGAHRESKTDTWKVLEDRV